MKLMGQKVTYELWAAYQEVGHSGKLMNRRPAISSLRAKSFRSLPHFSRFKSASRLGKMIP